MQFCAGQLVEHAIRRRDDGNIQAKPSQCDGQIAHHVSHAANLAFRQGQRYVARLVRQRNIETRPLTWHADASYLISGGYDLLVMVEGEDLLNVAGFVSEKLSTLEGVVSTATHFRLKTYKEKGFLFGESDAPTRLPVSP